MLDKLDPFNLDLLILSPENVKTLGQIKVLDIFDTSKNFHNDGLFSTSIFGKQGDERRNRTFAYIKLNTDVMHPLVAKTVFKLKGLYKEIAEGSTYAIFDTKIKDFVKTDPTEGSTGYSFFLKHLKHIQFEERKSARRSDAISLMTKYRDRLTMQYLVTMPAGLRDYTVDQDGKPSEDEINVMYRKVLSLSNIMATSSNVLNPEYLDNTKYRLQLSLIEIYDYIVNILEGKGGLIQSKWASRKIYDSTRNVITSWVGESDELFGITSVKADQTVVGLHQYLRNIMPLASNLVRETYLTEVFPGPNTPAVMVNKKTLQKEMVKIDSSLYLDWMTYEGFEATVGRFAEEDQRHDYLETEDHYFALMYKGPDNTFKVIHDIRELPEGRDPKDVTPLTFAELLYCSTYRVAEELPSFITRYPIAGYGSIHPCFLYLKSTVKSEVRYELDETWNIIEDNPAKSFPKHGETFHNSLSPHKRSIARLSADKEM